MKSLTFEEWDSLATNLATDDGPFWEALFNAARQGMIPADRAIEVPDVGEWPRHATAIRVTYDWDCVDEAIGAPVIAVIPRPVPAWTPKVGDAVFANDTEDSGYILTLKIHDIDDEGRCEMVDHFGTWWHRTHLKLFDQAKIGLPWEEI